MRYFGLDVHKFYCEGAELLPDNTIRRFRFPNERKEWKRFAKELDGNCKVALEATGNAAMIHDILTIRGAQVVVVNPIRTRLKRRGGSRRTRWTPRSWSGFWRQTSSAPAG